MVHAPIEPAAEGGTVAPAAVTPAGAPGVLSAFDPAALAGIGPLTGNGIAAARGNAPPAIEPPTSRPAKRRLEAIIDAARAAGPQRGEIVLRAMSLLGVNYRFGGNSPENGLDCSGFVRHVFRETVGTLLPRRSEEISRSGERVDASELKPGDLVFFNTLRRSFSHVGIYIGNNQFVHAPRRGTEVRVESMQGDYWTRRFNGARRIDDAGLDSRIGDLRLDALRNDPR